MNFIQIGDIPNLIPQRDIHHSLVNSDTQTLKRSDLLSAAGRPRRDKGAEHFACEGLFHPESAGGVTERFPLGGEVAEAGGDAYIHG